MKCKPVYIILVYPILFCFYSGCAEPSYFSLNVESEEVRLDSLSTTCQSERPQIRAHLAIDGYGQDAIFDRDSKHGATDLLAIRRDEIEYHIQVTISVKEDAVPGEIKHTYIVSRQIGEDSSIIPEPPGTETRLVWDDQDSDSGQLIVREQTITIPSC